MVDVFDATNGGHPLKVFGVVIFTGKISSVTCRMMMIFVVTKPCYSRPGSIVSIRSDSDAAPCEKARHEAERMLTIANKGFNGNASNLCFQMARTGIGCGHY